MKYFYVILILLVPMQVYANNNFIATIGYAYGGATIVDKDSSSSLIRFGARSKLKAGTGFQSEVGYDVQLSNDINVRYLIGYKYNTVDFSDTKHEFLTFPASMLVYYKHKRLSFGGGLTYHMKPSYKGTVQINNASLQDDPADFNNALGVSAMVNLALGQDDVFSLELRYTNISYEGAQAVKNSSGQRTERALSSFDASSFAIFTVAKF